MENNERKKALASTLPPCNKQLHFPPLMAYFIILCISCVRIPTCYGLAIIGLMASKPVRICTISVNGLIARLYIKHAVQCTVELLLDLLTFTQLIRH